MTPRTRRTLLPIAGAIGAVVLAGCALSDFPTSTVPASARPMTGDAAPIVTSGPTTEPPPPSPSSEPPVPSPRIASPTQELVDFLLERVAEDPQDGGSQRDLGLALLQRIRETGDPSLYRPAQAALEAARELVPDDPLVFAGIGALQLGLHEFSQAFDTATSGLERFPGYAALRSVAVDALIELGRYDEAFPAAASLAADSPDLATLARWSYTLELQGDLEAALAAMRAGADAAGMAPENSAYVLALVGHLERLVGDPDASRIAYEQALILVPGHPPSLAGLGRLAVGTGDLEAARRLFERASAIQPSPEYVIALGEALEVSGDDKAARDQFGLARTLITLSQANGVVVDVDLAVFEADHGDPATALHLASAGYAATPTIRAADAVAWALHRLGRDDEAAAWSAEALRLGSRDPLLLYHAGAIAAAVGHTEQARGYLERALATDPGFSPTGAADARAILAALAD